MRTRESEKTFPPVKARSLLYLPAVCLMLYAVHAYGETKSVTVTFRSHAYQMFKTTQPGENHVLNINKATPAPNIARSLITAQDEQDQVIWKPAGRTAAAQVRPGARSFQVAETRCGALNRDRPARDRGILPA